MTGVAHIVVAGLLFAGLLALYAAPLTGMVQLWDASPMYSYAYTVPPIAAFLLWARRYALVRMPLRPAPIAGGAVLASAVVMLVVGGTAAVQIVQQFSFVLALVGVVLILFGAAHLRLAAPALGYLLFMIPFWDVFTEPLHWPFQNNSATLGVAMLHAVGIPALREGTIIALSNVTLEVARQCSGVNYLIAVLALALPLSYLRLRSWWRRMLLITSALLVAALANGLRVALIGALAYWDIGSPLHGPFHMLHGLFVAGIGYVVLFAGLHVLEAGEQPGAGQPMHPAAASQRPRPWSVRTAGGLAVAFWTLTFVGTTVVSQPTALAMPLDRLPRQLGGWSMDFTEVKHLDTAAGWREADSQIHRQYRRADGKTATVQVWYYQSQAQGHELVNSGVALLHRGAVAREIAIPAGRPLVANVIRLPGEVALFWYELNGTPEYNQYGAKLKSLSSMLLSRRSNGAAIMLRAPSAGGTSDDALLLLQGLAAEVHTALAPHWNHASAPANINRDSGPEPR